MTEIVDVFLGSSDPLTPSNAVAALLVLPDGRYVMQLRDLKPHIFYPGHWGLFGGAVDEGEDERQALSRELAEELGFRPAGFDRFVRLDFDLSSIGIGKVYRVVYEVKVTNAEFASFRLHEGQACKALTARQILIEQLVTPYDSFAIWLHYHRERLRAGLPELPSM